MKRRGYLKSFGIAGATALSSGFAAAKGREGTSRVGSVATAGDAELFANLRFTVYEDGDGNYLKWGGCESPILVGTKTAAEFSPGGWEPWKNKSPSWAPSWTSETYNGGPLHYIPAIVEMHTEDPYYTGDVSFTLDGNLYGDRQIIAAYDPHDVLSPKDDWFAPTFGGTFDASELADASGRRKRFYLIVEGEQSGLYPLPTGVTIGDIDFTVKFGSDSNWRDQYGFSHTTSMDWSIAKDASQMDVEDNLLEPTRDILREIPALTVGMHARAVRTAATISSELPVSTLAKQSIKFMSKSDGYVEKAVNTLTDDSGKTEGSFLFTGVDQRLYNDPESIGDIGTGGPSIHFQE